MLMTPPLSLLLTPPRLSQSRCIGTPTLPEQIELHRDRMWRRDEDLRIENAVDAERFIEDVALDPIGLFAVYLIQSRREKSVAPQ